MVLDVNHREKHNRQMWAKQGAFLIDKLGNSDTNFSSSFFINLQLRNVKIDKKRRKL
jgi:hypothetical protein